MKKALSVIMVIVSIILSSFAYGDVTSKVIKQYNYHVFYTSYLDYETKIGIINYEILIIACICYR